mgnify:FL=1
MKNISQAETRLKKIISADKKENPIKIERLLKSEIYYILKNYFEINSEDMSLNLKINEDGKYQLQLNAISRSIKITQTF